jgi:hypothetical protein
VCRAPQPNYHTESEEEKADDEVLDLAEDFAELHNIISSLNGPVGSWGMQLQSARMVLEQRVAELDEEHQRLEGEIQRLQEDLHDHHCELCDLQAESSSLGNCALLADKHSVIEAAAASLSDSPSTSCTMIVDASLPSQLHHMVPTSALHRPVMLEDSLSFEQVCVSSSMGVGIDAPTRREDLAADEFKSHEMFVSNLVERLSGAVLRSPSPISIFHAIASRGQLLPSDLASVLHGFEADITIQQVEEVFVRLDYARKGFLDESTWMEVLHIHPASRSNEDLEQAHQAWELLGRVASALQRSGQSPADLFYAVGGGKPLSSQSLQQLLQRFEAPQAVVLQAVGLLSKSGKAEIDEAEFHDVFGGLMCTQSSQDVIARVS